MDENNKDSETEDVDDEEYEENDIQNGETNHKTNVMLNGTSSDTNNDILYECYAVSNHSGTLSGGHYTAYCRHPFSNVTNDENDSSVANYGGTQDSENKNTWHLYNDRAVSRSNAESVITGDAYLLFFEKV